MIYILHYVYEFDTVQASERASSQSACPPACCTLKYCTQTERVSLVTYYDLLRVVL